MTEGSLHVRVLVTTAIYSDRKGRTAKSSSAIRRIRISISRWCTILSKRSSPDASTHVVDGTIGRRIQGLLEVAYRR